MTPSGSDKQNQSLYSRLIWHPIRLCIRSRPPHSITMDGEQELFIQATIGLKIPQFWMHNPALWFAQIEAQFHTNRTTSDEPVLPCHWIAHLRSYNRSKEFNHGPTWYGNVWHVLNGTYQTDLWPLFHSRQERRNLRQAALGSSSKSWATARNVVKV